MKVVNNGKVLKIEAEFMEAAIITESLRIAKQKYEAEGNTEIAEQVNELLEDLINRTSIENN